MVLTYAVVHGHRLKYFYLSSSGPNVSEHCEQEPEALKFI
jgi:hypothetical protein